MFSQHEGILIYFDANSFDSATFSKSFLVKHLQRLDIVEILK